MSRGIFITGTGTDIGKTYVTALLLKKLRERTDAVYYKAALSGAELINGRLSAGDACYVCKTAGIPGDPNDYVSYIYKEPVSPHLAARFGGEPVSMARVKADFGRLSAEHGFVVAEGSGGIVCPIRFDGQQIMLTDIIRELGLDILIVSTAALGSINSAVLTYHYACSMGIRVRGFILNRYDKSDIMQADNCEMIQRLTGAPVVAYAEPDGRELVLLCDIAKELGATM